MSCIAYITRDEVNAALARQVKLPPPALLYHADSEDSLPNAKIDAIAYDVDHLFADERRRVLSELSRRPAALPTAVHSYNLSLEEEENLKLKGVLVCSRVSADLFGWLASRSDRQAA